VYGRDPLNPGLMQHEGTDLIPAGFVNRSVPGAAISDRSGPCRLRNR
jgi:hypothetical protein